MNKRPYKDQCVSSTWDSELYIYIYIFFLILDASIYFFTASREILVPQCFPLMRDLKTSECCCLPTVSYLVQSGLKIEQCFRKF